MCTRQLRNFRTPWWSWPIWRARQNERLLRHEAELEALAEALLMSEQKVARLKELQRRTEQNLAEITDKLKELIG